MDSFSFHALKTALGDGFDWTTADVRILLLDAAGAPDPDPAANTLDALGLDALELDTTNYARAEISGRVIERDDDASLARWVFDDVTLPDLGPETAGPTVGGAILYVHETDDSDSWPILALGDVTGTVTGSSFTIHCSPLGVVRIGDETA